jgi:hypothetical protein
MSETKKEKTKKEIVIKKENLEKILEIKKETDKKVSNIPEQNSSFKKINLPDKKVSLNKTNNSPVQKTKILERDLAKETTFTEDKKNNSEYISKTPEKASTKYQNYESNIERKFETTKEISKLDSRKRDVGFISSENINNQKRYENYIQPRKFEPKRFNEEKQKGKNISRIEMKYSSNH